MIASAGLLIGAGLLARAGYRLWRIETGRAAECPRCGGPQSGERNGRWSLHRRCYACGYYDEIARH